VAGVPNPEYAYGDTENYTYSAQDAAAAENAKQQRRQAALEQKSAIQQQAVQIMEEANGARQKMRVEMTQKYNIEF
jgi:hypothetical protein